MHRAGVAPCKVVGSELINAIFRARESPVGCYDASIKRGVTGDILVKSSTMLYVTDVLISFVQIVTPR